MDRKATAVWNGTLKEGIGKLNSASRTLVNVGYSSRMRFEDEPGTNPEELIAAAHAGCFAMALSLGLANAGATPESIEATATVSLETVDGKPTLTKSHLDVVVRASGIAEDAFQRVANETKEGCPVSRALNVDKTLSARLA